MHDLARRLLKTIRKQELLRPGDRVAAAVSGGADSVALLLLLEELQAELGIVLSVAHVNHQLRGAESDDDERFVANLAARLQLNLDVVTAPIETRASKAAGEQAKSGIEAAARNLRYGFFRELAENRRVTKIATAHTLDDQAETVLLRIFRGTGIRGLAGIHPKMSLANWSPKRSSPKASNPKTGGTGALAPAGTKSAGKFSAEVGVEVIRPLLIFRRSDLRDYLRTSNETWREDSSNADPKFLRNRIRQRLLPLIAEEFGDAALLHMAELAEIARAEEGYWSASESKARRKDVATPAHALDVNNLRSQPLAVQRRRLRSWLEANAPEVRISFALIQEILELANGPAGKKLEVPSGAGSRNVRRRRNELTLEAPASSTNANYEYVLQVPGEVTVPELSARIQAQLVNVDSVPDLKRGALLDANCVGATLTIRNWRAGDRYWPAHTAAAKKVKELLADRHATGAKKKLWPVAQTHDGRLVWMQGFPAPASFQPRTSKAIWIHEFASEP
jgi:tRNA(Ile)-lysidine synthase